MRTRWLLNLALAGLMLSLAGVIWLRPGKPAPQLPPPLTTVDGTRVNTITLTPERGAPFTLRRTDGAWFVTGPLHARARQYRVESVLGLLGTAQRATLPVPPPGDNPYGLAPPKARIRFDDTEIRFGDSNPVDYRRYVGTGTGAFLIDDAYFHHLGTTPADWVDLALLPPGARIEAVDAPGWRLERDATGGYALTPGGGTLSADTLAQRADDWAHVQATDVTPASTQAPAPHSVTLTYRMGDGAPVTVRFGLVDDGRAVSLIRTDPPLAYALAPEEARRLLARPRDVPVQDSETGADDGSAHRHELSP